MYTHCILINCTVKLFYCIIRELVIKVLTSPPTSISELSSGFTGLE